VQVLLPSYGVCVREGLKNNETPAAFIRRLGRHGPVPTRSTETNHFINALVKGSMKIYESSVVLYLVLVALIRIYHCTAVLLIPAASFHSETTDLMTAHLVALHWPDGPAHLEAPSVRRRRPTASQPPEQNA
jgi:hypothetical protein